MAYLLDSQSIRRPLEIKESNSTQVAIQRVLTGAIGRDYFGSNKRVWELTYENVKKADYDTINAIYTSYLSSNTTKTWQITETNYPVAQTNVHVDLQMRSFTTRGSDYISDFTLTLTEA